MKREAEKSFCGMQTPAHLSLPTGRLKVDWDSYWQGFMSIPLIEAVRFALIKGACERLLKQFPRRGNYHFCELGAGTASVSRYLGDTYQADITIVDSNPRALDLSRKTFEGFPHRFQTIARDVFDLKDCEGRFDLVHSGGLIEHFVGEARDRIIEAHCALVKDHGYLMILVPIRNTWYKILNEGIFKGLRLLDHIPEVPWSFEELKTSLERRGFHIIARTTVVTELGILAKRDHKIFDV